MTKKNVPLKLPFYVYDSTAGHMVKIDTFTGRVCILGFDSDNGSIEIMQTIACSDLTVSPPDPIYIDVENFIDTNSLDIKVVLVPTSVSDSTLISQMSALLAS